MGRPKLREALDRVQAVVVDGRLPLVVFDLDSTLFTTAYRNLRILREFADAHAARFPDLLEHLDALEHSEMGWNVLEPLRRRGYEHPELTRAFGPFWVERFFTDAYLEADEPNPGAAEYARACHARGALLYYLTGRHVGGMEVGTVRSLTRHGFPFWRGRCVLHLKPSFDEPDLAYKTEAIADIRSHRAEVVATFENEPGNANLFLRSFPEALHFLLQTEHSPDAESPDPALIPIPDFTH